jgi:hypothetical protein
MKVGEPGLVIQALKEYALQWVKKGQEEPKCVAISVEKRAWRKSRFRDILMTRGGDRHALRLLRLDPGRGFCHPRQG